MGGPPPLPAGGRLALGLAALALVTGRRAVRPGELQIHNADGADDPSTLPYQLFVPTAPLGADELRPVLVFLHGAGDGPFVEMNQQSLPGLLLRNASFAQSFPFVSLFPCSTCGVGSRGWNPDSFSRVDRLIEMAIHEHGGDPHRIALTGQSMGGAGLWRYAASRPRVFSALVPVCAAMFPSPTIAGAVCCLAGPGAGCCPPVWAFHGKNDGSVPVDATDRMLDILRGARRGQVVRYTRYEWAPPPPMPEYAMMEGHGSYELAYRDTALYAWLLEQRCEQCTGPPAMRALGSYSVSGAQNQH